MDRLTALLDANVLYPASIRDVLLRLADQYLYKPLWSADINEEWIRNLLENRPGLPVDKVDRIRVIMDEHFPNAAVTGYQSLIEKIDLPDPDDRHVLAAAIHGQADVIVTLNLRDFPADRLAPYALEARHPDTFIAGLFDSRPGAVLAAVRGHRAALKNPPRSPDEHLLALESTGLVQTASVLQEYRDVI